MAATLHFHQCKHFSERSPSFRFTTKLITATIVTIEVDGDMPLRRFVHPQSAVYLFGGEDRTVPRMKGPRVHIESRLCLNLGMATTLVMYDRARKLDRSERVGVRNAA